MAAFGAAVTGAFLLLVGPVIGDGLNSSPDPAPVVIATTHPATSAQVAGARGLASASTVNAGRKRRTRTVVRRVTITS
ncbi:MAG TPA: hypothetical protein PLJ64_10595, partial [Solirubrobacterales bacterium]|nr:hypothetical protein [Solirubrobacterales bacterium]